MTLAFLVKQECHDGVWHIVTYAISDDGSMTKSGDIVTAQPCGDHASPPPPITTDPSPIPPGLVQPPRSCMSTPIADPPKNRQFPASDKHKPTGVLARLLQSIDLLSDEPAHLAGYDWAYDVNAYCQSTADTFTCEIAGFGWVYHALGNSEDKYRFTYKATISCEPTVDCCKIKVDDTGSITRKVGACLTVQIFPTWTTPSCDTLQLALQITVSLDAGSTGAVAGPGGGSGGTASFPGGQPGYQMSLGTYQWKCLPN